MTSDTVTIIVAIIAALGSAYSVIYARRKAKADALTTYDDLVAKQAKRLTELSDKLDCIDAELDAVLNGVGLLIAQLRAAGLEPVWTPAPRKRSTDTPSK